MKVENISTDHVYALNNLCSEINNLVSDRDKVINTMMKHAQNF